jgi:hypothetical protein
MKTPKRKQTNYKRIIADGKSPNIFFAFQYDEKFYTRYGKNEQKVKNNAPQKGGLIGKYKTYKAAKIAIENMASLSHVFIEDRITGMVYEQYIEVCKCCGNEILTTIEDYEFSKEITEKSGKVFN